MTLPDTMQPVLLRALSIAIDDRTRHLDAAERDASLDADKEAQQLREELLQLRAAQLVLMRMVLDG